ncbi:MAG TPA: hypothetical protein VGO11_02580 [Chthoniobacteraceae bacterium]|jgi:hypothetical protein|nr:hypothetical protein [Chthoniobacteraceae bacterium]
MKTLLLVLLLNAGWVFADVEPESLRKLTDELGKTFWSPPEKRLVRATI